MILTKCIWSKTQRSKNQCKAWSLVPRAIIKCECWVPACVFPLLCQQEQFIGNCEHSEADHTSLAHKPYSKAPSPLWLLCRTTENPLWACWPGDREVPLLDGFICCPVDSLVMILGAVQVVSAVVGPHTSKGTCRNMGRVTVSMGNKVYRCKMHKLIRVKSVGELEIETNGHAASCPKEPFQNTNTFETLQELVITKALWSP